MDLWYEEECLRRIQHMKYKYGLDDKVINDVNFIINFNRVEKIKELKDFISELDIDKNIHNFFVKIIIDEWGTFKLKLSFYFKSFERDCIDMYFAVADDYISYYFETTDSIMSFNLENYFKCINFLKSNEENIQNKICELGLYK